MSSLESTGRISLAALVGAALMLGPPAAAQSGPYVAGHVGLAIQGDSSLLVTGSPSFYPPFGQASGSVSYEPGWMIDGALGWRISHFRVEANVSYSANSAERLELGALRTPLPGGIQSVGAMANAYYDIPLSKRIRPYVGGGVGAAYLTFETNTVILGSGFYVDDNDTRFAWNLMTGLGFGLGDHVVLDVGYRYFQTMDATFPSKVALPSFPFTRLDLSVVRHDVLAGVRYEF